MSKCPECGREIGKTAGPCVQCTMELKEKGISITTVSGCPSCKGNKINQIDPVLFLCESCNRVF